MSSFVTKLTGLIGGGIVETIGKVADRFIETPDERSKFKIAIEQVLQKRESEVEQTIRAELKAKERVIVAELEHGDNYTKRARPTVVYFGLGIIAFNYCLVPLVQLLNGSKVDPFALPTEFWLAWGGCVGIYNIGRSMEKRGFRNKATKLMSDSKKSLFD